MNDEVFDPRRYDDHCDECQPGLRQYWHRGQQRALAAMAVTIGVVAAGGLMQLVIYFLYAG